MSDGVEPVQVSTDGIDLRPLFVVTEQIARSMVEEQGFDRAAVTVSLLAAAEAIAREHGDLVAFALQMNESTLRLLHEVCEAVAASVEAARN